MERAPLLSRIHGRVVPAVPVPFDSRGGIDDATLGEYAAWMSGQAIGAVALWVHTGRGLLISQEERDCVLATWRGAVGSVPIICGAGVPTGTTLPGDAAARTRTLIDAAVAMADAAKRGGADAILAYPPAALRGLPDARTSIVDYHTAIAQAGLPVFAFYLYDAAGGIAYDTGTLDAIMSTENVVGIKLATLDSVMTFQDVSAHLMARRNTIILTGEDRFLGYSLTLGAHGALIGMAAACTDRCVRLLESWERRDLETFQALSAALDRFAMVTFRAPMEGYIQRMLWALEADGVISRPATDKFAPAMDPTERNDVFNAVARLRGV